MTICQPMQWMTASTDGSDQTVCDLILAYDPGSPYGVELRFLLDGEDPEAVLVWHVDRSLLATGIDSWAGDGDVHVSIWAPRPHLVLVRLLDGQTGRWGRFLARHQDLTEFLAATYALVPAGTEQVDVDTALTEFLGGQSP